MLILKYTVANKEGKKLSGTIEAPDEQTAKTELNNLGFSVINLQLTQELPKEEISLPKYVFEAVDKNSKLISGTISASNEEEVFKKLNTEYGLIVTAIWKENAAENQIEEARRKGTKIFQEKISSQIKEKNFEEQKTEEFIKAKIEFILKQVYNLLKNFDQNLSVEQKEEINKRINKLLRIKQSKNVEYILATAEDLLHFIEAQEKELREKGFEEKRIELKVQTKKLLDELNRSESPKTLSEDIVKKIDHWQRIHAEKEKKLNQVTKFINDVLLKIRNIFKTPPQILVIKEQIKTYNKQIIEFIKIYFKEPTKEYKQKVKNAIKTVWRERKKTIHVLKQAKKLLKEEKKTSKGEEHLILSFIEELNSLTGWLLGFYLIYYLVSLYLTTKDFGIANIPKGFYVYESRIFKYILIILFLLHAATALKINFFKKSHIASAVLIPIFIIGTIIVLLNF